MPADDDGTTSNPNLRMVKAGSKLFFAANDGKHGTELWVWMPKQRS